MVTLHRTSSARPGGVKGGNTAGQRDSCGCPGRLVDRSCGHERGNAAFASYGLAVRKPGKEIPQHLSPPHLLTHLGPSFGQTQPKARGQRNLGDEFGRSQPPGHRVR